jgi:hypothetical protein
VNYEFEGAHIQYGTAKQHPIDAKFPGNRPKGKRDHKIDASLRSIFGPPKEVETQKPVHPTRRKPRVPANGLDGLDEVVLAMQAQHALSNAITGEGAYTRPRDKPPTLI